MQGAGIGTGTGHGARAQRKGSRPPQHRLRAYEQDRKLAWLERQRRQQSEADHETGQGGDVAPAEDEQSIPPAHYASPPSGTVSPALQVSHPQSNRCAIEEKGARGDKTPVVRTGVHA